jgi:hypothetical protein
MVKVKGLPMNLYPPDAAPGHTPSPDSPFVLACKRTLGRIGAWPWEPDQWDDSYSNRFSHGDGWDDQDHAGIEGIQHWSGTIEATGWVGESTFNFLRSVRVPAGRTHAGEPAMDQVAAQLVNQAYDQAHPTVTPESQTEQVQRTIQDYCRRALTNATNWHYRQYRPMQSLGQDPDGIVYSDCSEGVTAAYYWANQSTGLDVPDPNGSDYNGYGWTETLWDNNPNTYGPDYRVGDLALYSANGGHVTLCIQAGDESSACWWSNGSEGGPYQEPLKYRTDLRGVVRPELLA